MAIYHLEAKVVGRGAGRSAVAASAYLSCSRLYNDYDGIQHDYTKKQGLVWQQVFLPEYAPQEWQNREKLWNAVEEVETAKDSRLAREFVVALPIELSREQQIELLQDFIREQFVSDGMCADAAIHDTDGHNPHAHILLTVRPLDERGKWQYKTEKEYLCMKNGEERGFTAAEFKAAQNEGWEKQYPYKVGKKKVYMTPSAAEAQGLVRADKHPKSTRYGRQNPISERWNSEEQLAAWRAAWAAVSNCHLERAGREERIDHRSNAARGLDEIPTIHEGVTARALERKGMIADRCEINRQIKADNALLWELKAEIKKLAALVARTVPAIAEGLEKLRSRVLIFCYQLSHIRSGKSHIQKSLSVWKPELERYAGLVQQIKEKSKERKALVAEKKELPIYHVKHHKALALRIAELTEELEELRSGKALLLQKFEYAEDAGAETFRKDIATMEAGLKKLEAQEQKYSAELDKALDEYAELKAQAADFDPVELYKARQVLRPAQEKAVKKQLEDTMQEKPSLIVLLSARQETSRLLGEDVEERQARQMVMQRQKEQRLVPQNQSKKKEHWER
ncbi:MAG: MobQ family relaxase [Vescimonas sp.]